MLLLWNAEAHLLPSSGPPAPHHYVMTSDTQPKIPLLNSRVVNWFLPPSMRRKSDHKTYDLRAVILIGLALIFWGPVYSALCFFVFDVTPMAVAVGITTVLSFAALFLVRLTASAFWTSQSICSTLLILVVWMAWQTDGIVSPVMNWVLAVPILATVFLHDRRWSIFWTLTVCAVVTAVYTAPVAGIEPTSMLADADDRRLYFGASMVGLMVLVLSVFAVRHGIDTWVLDKAGRAHESAWKKSRQSLYALMENSPKPVIVHHDLTLIYANPAFYELVGISGEESLEGGELTRFARDEDEAMLRRSLEVLRQRDSLRARETILVKDDGTEIPVEVTAFRSTFDQAPVFVSIIIDLSESRALQARMMQMDRMIAVGTLAAGVAHEINNPLAFVHANVEFMLRRLTGEADELFGELSAQVVEETLRDTLRGTLRIRDIVADLRSFATSADHKLQPVDVEHLVESAVNMAWNQIKQRATLTRDFQGLPNIECDESGMAQIILNLLVNAAQSIPEGAPEENRIHLSTRLEDEEVIVAVRDTGTGIGADIIDRIFDPFFSTKSQDQGMGLGLSICRNLAQGMGGRLEVDSQAGKGSTFRVIVPARVTPEDSMEIEVIHDLADVAGGRGIIIDDEPAVLRALERQLSEAYRVETFQSAGDALEGLDQGEKPCFILCDLQMPQISGVEFYRRLQESGSGLDERVVFMTGGAFTEGVQEFLDSVDRPVIEKPFSLAELLEVIEETEPEPRA
jgi:PAS domain S-box-containing protein